MNICPKCGAENDDAYVFCTVCRSYLGQIYNIDVHRVTYYPNKGLIAWSIFTILLFSRIAGIIALVNAASINNCTSVYVQDHRVKAAKVWNIMGVFLGIAAFIVIFIYRTRIH